jgi:hypothetical protein
MADDDDDYGKLLLASKLREIQAIKNSLETFLPLINV